MVLFAFTFTLETNSTESLLKNSSSNVISAKTIQYKVTLAYNYVINIFLFEKLKENSAKLKIFFKIGEKIASVTFRSTLYAVARSGSTHVLRKTIQSITYALSPKIRRFIIYQLIGKIGV